MDEKEWDQDTEVLAHLEAVATAMVRGADVWQVARTFDLTPDIAERDMARVAMLWVKVQGETTGERRQRSIAQLNAIKLEAWQRYDAKERRDHWLRLALDCEREIANLNKRAAIGKLPEWVPTYLAAWGSPRPDGKAMSVIWASSLAGTTDSNVRSLRKRSPQFRRMEYMARFGTAEGMGEYIDAGLRGNAPTIFGKFMQLVNEGNVQAILKGVEWARGKPTKVEMEVTGAPQTHIYIPDNRREPTGPLASSGQVAPEKIKSAEEEKTVDAAVALLHQGDWSKWLRVATSLWHKDADPEGAI